MPSLDSLAILPQSPWGGLVGYLLSEPLSSSIDSEPSTRPTAEPTEPPKRVSTSGSLSRHRVRNSIERMILTGELAPKQRLVQLELAKKFDVAQSVVREALLELLSSGLVRSVDNLGMHVCDMHPGWLIHAYEIRELFEGLAARTCCETATQADIREMYLLVDRNYEFGKKGMPEQRSESDRDFHTRIILASRNELLANLTESCRALGMAVRNLRPLDVVYAEHRAIVRAIEDRRPEKAERAARQHIRAAREAIQKSIEEGSFSPAWVLPQTQP